MTFLIKYFVKQNISNIILNIFISFQAWISQKLHRPVVTRAQNMPHVQDGHPEALRFRGQCSAGGCLHRSVVHTIISAMSRYHLFSLLYTLLNYLPFFPVTFLTPLFMYIPLLVSYAQAMLDFWGLSFWARRICDKNIPMYFVDFGGGLDYVSQGDYYMTLHERLI